MVQTDRKLVPFSRHNHRCIFTKKGATCKIKTFVKKMVEPKLVLILLTNQM